MKVVIMGQGYVGLPVAMRAVEVGHDVVGYEVDTKRVKALQQAESYIEDITSDDLAAALATGRYKPTDDLSALSEFEVAVITVPTPLREGLPDLSYIEDAGNALATYIGSGATVILESTTYPGTTEELLVPILEDGSGLSAGHDFHVGYSPERIDPGNPTWTFVNTPKVVSGIDRGSLDAVSDFYASIIDTVVPVRSPKEAELTKLIENTFRHVNVALVNELAMFAGDLGIDVWNAIDAAATKPFGFMKFTPGPGVGGHCLPIDPSYLSWQVRRRLGHSFRFVELANDINEHMPDYVVRRLIAGLNKRERAINGSSILLLGLSYKRNTGDARESPALHVANALLDLGADVRAADPFVRPNGHGIKRVSATQGEIVASHAVVLLTDHDCFDYDLIGRTANYALDTRNRLTGPGVEHL